GEPGTTRTPLRHPTLATPTRSRYDERARVRSIPAWGRRPVWQSGTAHVVAKMGWISIRKLTVRPRTGEDVVGGEGVPGVVVSEDVVVATSVVVVVTLPGAVTVATIAAANASIIASRTGASPGSAQPPLSSALCTARVKRSAFSSRHAVPTGTPV